MARTYEVRAHIDGPRPPGRGHVIARCTGFDHWKYEVVEFVPGGSRWVTRVGAGPVHWAGPFTVLAAVLVDELRGWKQLELFPLLSTHSKP